MSMLLLMAGGRLWPQEGLQQKRKVVFHECRDLPICTAWGRIRSDGDGAVPLKREAKVVRIEKDASPT
jgi:hypothetical protein